MAKSQVLPIDLLRTDGNTQSRKSINEDTVSDYADTWKQAAPECPFPPCDVFHDGDDYWVADGFHRVLGGQRAKRGSIPCKVHKGTKRDAFLFAVQANNEHGLRPTRVDKRFAVTRLLKDEEWGKLSLRQIAALACVSHAFVRTLKAELNPPESPVNVYTKPEGGNSKKQKKSGPSPATYHQDREDDGETSAVEEIPPRAHQEPTGTLGEHIVRQMDHWEAACYHFKALKAKDQRRFIDELLAHPCTLDDVVSYVAEMGYKFAAEAFWDYFVSVGWVVGKGKKMKSWRHACSTFERNEGEKNGRAKSKSRIGPGQTYQRGAKVGQGFGKSRRARK